MRFDALIKFLGLKTTQPSHSISIYDAANSIGINYSATFQIAPEKGWSLYGNRWATDGGSIIRIKEIFRNDARSVTVRIRDDGTNSHLEWLNKVDVSNQSEGEWETLLPNLTTGKIPLVETYNSYLAGGIPTDINQMIFSNGAESFSLWNIAFTTVASNTDTTITANSVAGYANLAALGFDATGTIIVDGTEYAYTGLDDWQFTGLSDLPTFDVNTGIAQAVVDSGTVRTIDITAIDKIDVGLVADARLWGSISASSTALVASQAGEAINFTVSTNPGDPLIKAFVEGQDGILNIQAKDEKIFLLGNNFISFYELEYPSSTTRVEKSKTFRQGAFVGVASKLGATKVENDIWYVSKIGGIKSLFTIEQNTFDTDDLTKDIRPTIKDFDFTSCATAYDPSKKVFVCACKSSSTMAFNDKLITIYLAQDENKTLVKSIDIRPAFFNDFTITKDGKLLGASSISSNVYKLFDGYSVDGAPYKSLRTFKRLNYGLYFNEKEQGYIPLVGGLVPGTILHYELDYDVAGSRGHIEGSISALDTQYFTEPTYNTNGAFEIGSEPIGGTIEDISDYLFFRVHLSLPRDYSFYDIQLTLWSEGTGQKWFVDALGIPQVETEGAVTIVEEMNSNYYKGLIND